MCLEGLTKEDVKDYKEVKLSNGKIGIKGKCPTCGKNVGKVLDAPNGK